MSLLYTQHTPSTAHDPSSVADHSFSLDLETAALIAKLALEDIEYICNSRKGKAREDTPLSDEELAYQLQFETFQQVLVSTEDAKLAKSIDDAMSTDIAYLESFVVAEEAAAADRRTAEMLSRGMELPTPTAAQARVEKLDFVMHPDPPTINVGPCAGDKAEDAGMMPVDAPTVLVVSPGDDLGKTRTCNKCTKEVEFIDALRPPCGNHFYCKSCVRILFERSMQVKLIPDCCSIPIPIEDIAPFISASSFKSFQLMRIELSIPRKDRIYCYRRLCATFIGSSAALRLSTFVVCPACKTRWCPQCKRVAHLPPTPLPPFRSRFRSLLIPNPSKARQRSPSPKCSTRRTLTSPVRVNVKRNLEDVSYKYKTSFGFEDLKNLFEWTSNYSD